MGVWEFFTICAPPKISTYIFIVFQFHHHGVYIRRTALSQRFHHIPRVQKKKVVILIWNRVILRLWYHLVLNLLTNLPRTILFRRSFCISTTDLLLTWCHYSACLKMKTTRTRKIHGKQSQVRSLLRKKNVKCDCTLTCGWYSILLSRVPKRSKRLLLYIITLQMYNNGCFCSLRTNIMGRRNRIR